jgi:hypothetical protein
MRLLPVFRWILLAALAVATTGAAQMESWLTYRAIREMPAAAVAQRLIGPELGADVERVESRRDPMLPAALDVMLFHRPVPVGRDYCGQSVHELTLFTIRHEGAQTVLDDDGLWVQHRDEWNSLARAPACGLSAGQRFASIGSADSNTAMQALDDLAYAQVRAAGLGRLRIQLRCRDEVAYDPDQCRRGARAILATLPLDRICSIDRDREDPQAIEAVICLDDSVWARGFHWSVRIRDFGSDHPRLSLTWKDPAPF